MLVLLSRDHLLEGVFCSIAAQVGTAGFECLAAEHVDSIVAFRPAVVIVHVHGDDDENVARAAVQQLALAHLRTPVVAVCERYDAEQALRLARSGVMEVLCRPLDIRRAAQLLNILMLRHEFGPTAVAGKPSSQTEFVGAGQMLVGSAAMRDTLQQIKRVARLRSTVLLMGETGTGKTSAAELIHEFSGDAKAPFIAVNCAALPDTLIESELFGHRRGAFTGADVDRAGRFTEARNGTLFLDEIEALPLATQAKLLRVIDQRAYEELGSNKPLKLQARIIAASNASLEEEVAKGQFRSDLFFRLNVVGIALPPLRAQREVVLSLAEHFVRQFAAEYNQAVPRMARGVVERLLNHDWPGNVRELRNAMERAIAFCENGEIQVSDLPPHLQCSPIARNALVPGESASSSVEPQRRTDELANPDSPGIVDSNADEVRRIRTALERAGNNRTRAASELGISRTALYKKLRRLGMMPIYGSSEND
jgi:DNA-binding NtrC family response regulator